MLNSRNLLVPMIAGFANMLCQLSWNLFDFIIITLSLGMEKMDTYGCRGYGIGPVAGCDMDGLAVGKVESPTTWF